MTGYADMVAEHRRLVILRVLAEAPGYSANESILHSMLESFGLRCSRDQARAELTWLAEVGLIGLAEIEGVMIAEVTKRGTDVARGLSTVKGVKKPAPGG